MKNILPRAIFVLETSSATLNLSVNGQNVTLSRFAQNLDQLVKSGCRSFSYADIHRFFGLLQGVEDAVHVRGLQGVNVGVLKEDGFRFSSLNCKLLSNLIRKSAGSFQQFCF